LLRRVDAVVVLVGLAIIFVWQPGGSIEQFVRIVTGIAAIFMYAFMIGDEHRKYQKAPRSKRVETIEQYVLVALWVFIGLSLFVLFVVLPHFRD
jgi:hypothetical protein